MELTLIPHEEGNKSSPRFKIELKANSKDSTMLTQTCSRLFKYIEKGEKFSLLEVNKLLKNMERSIISIQKRKKSIVEKTAKKLQRRSKKRYK